MRPRPKLAPTLRTDQADERELFKSTAKRFTQRSANTTASPPGRECIALPTLATYTAIANQYPSQSASQCADVSLSLSAGRTVGGEVELGDLSVALNDVVNQLQAQFTDRHPLTEFLEHPQPGNLDMKPARTARITFQTHSKMEDARRGAHNRETSAPTPFSPSFGAATLDWLYLSLSSVLLSLPGYTQAIELLGNTTCQGRRWTNHTRTSPIQMKRRGARRGV